jgi:hypothetical protein
LHADAQVIIVVTHCARALHVASDVLTGTPLTSVHDCVAPHNVPIGLLPLFTHTEAPVEHDVVPTLHGSVGVHATPAVHGTQLPELQTWFTPQPVPLASDVPVSMQVWLPVEQICVPVWQGLPGVQEPPDAHGTQLPSLHTRLLPHDVPFAMFPVSAQTGKPVTHEFAPVLHLFAGWQLAPGVHMPHTPLLQTRLMPQEAPLTRFLLVSVQVIDGEHDCVPAWHGFDGMQASPTVQDTQLPLLHTMFVPQVVPLATFPDSAQTGRPVLHVYAPVRQGLPLTVQAAPTVQSTQAAVELQTLFVPQPVPAATFVPLSMQTPFPVEQLSVP